VTPLRVFLVSGYHTGSHRAWAEGYAASSRHDVHLVTMPGTFWKWRLGGGFVTLAEQVEDLAARVGRPEALLASSMVDVAGLRGLVRWAGEVPVALYMHENQVTYPATGRTRVEQRHGLATWTSLLAADTVAFNSEFHRSSLLAALPGFLGSFPDASQTHHLDAVAAKSVVLPVGCELAHLARGPKVDPPLILWNHRWDDDKHPEVFLELMSRLAATGAHFGVALAGERFVDQRARLEPAVAALGDLVVLDGHLSRDEYSAVIAAAAIVVSTAEQEFFGIAVVEAMHAGAFPILPRGLVYPERIPAALQARCLYRSPEEAVELLGVALADPALRAATTAVLQGTTAVYDWRLVAPAYDAWLQSLTEAN
jgi:glycosyltransferase involved in cell wall biosynthesis